MKVIKASAAFFVSILLNAHILYAQEILTWEECIDEAKENHPDLVSAAEKVKQANIDKDIEASSMLPQVDGEASGKRTQTTTKDAKKEYTAKISNTYTYGITGKQLLFDGFNIARKLGHTVVPLKPALVPLKTKESWVRDVQGLSLRNIRVTFYARTSFQPGRKDGGKKITSGVGEIVFTHFGVSGPLVLDLSGRVVSMLDECREITLLIDLKPALEMERLESRLLREFGENRNAKLKNVMKSLLPHRLIPVFLGIAGIVPEKNVNQISRQERRAIPVLLKALPLTVVGSLSLEEAMVTNGGISTKEINPRTMESRILAGLYFAGEMIDGCASSGGYNLQQAFSTGYLAGEAASACAG